MSNISNIIYTDNINIKKYFTKYISKKKHEHSSNTSIKKKTLRTNPPLFNTFYGLLATHQINYISSKINTSTQNC